MQATRTLTVSENLTISKGRVRKLSTTPKITLTGKWLAEQGFKAGQKIHVTLTQRTLTITHQ